MTHQPTANFHAVSPFAVACLLSTVSSLLSTNSYFAQRRPRLQPVSSLLSTNNFLAQRRLPPLAVSPFYFPLTAILRSASPGRPP